MKKLSSALRKAVANALHPTFPRVSKLERDIHTAEGMLMQLGHSADEAALILRSTACPPDKFYAHLSEGWQPEVIVNAYNVGLTLPRLNLLNPTADEIALYAELGQDVSRHFTNDGRMKPPFDSVVIDND